MIRIAIALLGTMALYGAAFAEDKDASSSSPGHQMQEHGSKEGSPGASGHAPGHEKKEGAGSASGSSSSSRPRSSGH